MTTHTQPGFKFCRQCGVKIAFAAPQCPYCQAHDPDAAVARPDVSPKSFGTAVTLCGLFGIVGVHHFYLGNILHGLIDLGLFALAIALFITGSATENDGYTLMGWLVLAMDAIHSTVVFFLLIVGKAKDARGRIVAYPGQMT